MSVRTAASHTSMFSYIIWNHQSSWVLQKLFQLDIIALHIRPYGIAIVKYNFVSQKDATILIIPSVYRTSILYNRISSWNTFKRYNQDTINRLQRKIFFCRIGAITPGEKSLKIRKAHQSVRSCIKDDNSLHQIVCAVLMREFPAVNPIAGYGTPQSVYIYTRASPKKQNSLSSVSDLMDCYGNSNYTRAQAKFIKPFNNFEWCP